MTRWQRPQQGEEHRALRRLIKLHSNELTNIAEYCKEDQELKITLTESTKRLISLNPKVSETTQREAALQAINSWLHDKARLFLTALKQLPASTLTWICHNMKSKAPLEYFKALAWNAQTASKSHIAVRFADRVENGIANPETTIANYIAEVYDSEDRLPER